MKRIIFFAVAMALANGSYAKAPEAASNLGTATTVASQAADGPMLETKLARRTLLLSAFLIGGLAVAIGAVDKDADPITGTPPTTPPPTTPPTTPPVHHTPASHH